MPVERRGQAIRVMINKANWQQDEPDWLRRRAAVLDGWHEPCGGRLSRTVLSAPRGEIPRADSAAGNGCPYRDLNCRAKAHRVPLRGTPIRAS